MIEVDVSHSLAHANVDVGDRISDFSRMADRFARKNGFLIIGGSYPRDGRQVVNIEIDTDKDKGTILLMSNFRAENTLETNIYSSEGVERWKRIWLDFMQLASSQFGADHVKVVPIRTQ